MCDAARVGARLRFSIVLQSLPLFRRVLHAVNIAVSNVREYIQCLMLLTSVHLGTHTPDSRRQKIERILVLNDETLHIIEKAAINQKVSPAASRLRWNAGTATVSAHILILASFKPQDLDMPRSFTRLRLP